MKKAVFIGLAMFFALMSVSVSFAADKKGLDLKVGDEVFVCGCGEGCPCQTMSMTAGKCTCNKDLVKSEVTKVEEGKATVMVNGKEQTFKTVGLYECPCGPGCKCKTISQSPGKCSCGQELKKVE